MRSIINLKQRAIALVAAVLMLTAGLVAVPQEAKAATVTAGSCVVNVDNTSGVSTYDGGTHCYVAFKSTGITYTWTRPSALTSFDLLVVAGGGGGASRHAGGGGGGGLIQEEGAALNTNTLSIVVGAGGAAAGAQGAGVGADGANGGNSQISGASFTTRTAIGGGGGAFGATPLAGGSGGGGGTSSTVGGTPTTNQGSWGGRGFNSGASWYAGGGGGGAGGNGGDASGTSQATAGYGGPGRGITWIPTAAQAFIGGGQAYNGFVYFAAGGGGSVATTGTGGTGGIGGGGNGGSVGAAGVAGTANTGGGGGAGAMNASGNTSQAAGAGGSGVVIIRYAKPAAALSYNASDEKSYDSAASTTFVNDLSTSNYDGTLASQSNGQRPGFNTSNGAWTFSGGATGVGPYIDVTSMSSTNFATYGMTFDFEADFGSQQNGWERIADFSEAGAANDGFLISRQWTTGDLVIEIWNNGVSAGQCNAAGSIPSTSQMIRWTISIDGTTCNIYKDGTRIHNVAYSGKPASGITWNDNYLGRSNWADASFEGSIRTFNMYAGAFSPAELNDYTYKTALYNSYVGGADTIIGTKFTSGAVRLPAPASRPGYVFTGWFSDTTNTNRVGGAGDYYYPSTTLTLFGGWRSVDSAVTGNLVLNFDATNIQSLPSAATSAKSIYPALTTTSASGVVNGSRDTANSPGALVQSATGASAVSFGTGGVANISGDISYETWVKFSTVRTGTSAWNVIASHWFSNSTGTDAMDWHLGIYEGKLRLNTTTGQVNGAKTWSSADQNVWYHLAFTVNAAGTAQLYVNGQPDGASVANIPHTANSSALLWIGDGRTNTTDIRMHGYISRARLYNAALTGSQMRSNYNLESVTYGRTAVQTLTYKPGPNGAGSDAVEYYSAGASATLKNASAGFTRSGYVISGWTTSSTSGASSTNSLSSSLTINSDVTLYPVWSAATNVITYDYNGATGGNGTTSSSYTSGGTAITLPTPTKTGYTFAGWFSDAGLTTQVTGTQTPSSSYTLYAKWTAATFTLTYTYNGATGGNGTASDSFTTGGTAITLPTPTKTGYTFAGWYSDAGLTTQVSGAQSPTANATLYAKWTAGTFTITYTYNGATGGNSTTSSSYTTGGTAITLPTPTKTGYTFAGWFAESTFATAVTGAQSPSADATLYAKWTAIQYTLTYNANGATGGSVPTDSNNYIIGNNASVAANSLGLVRTGYTWAGWTLASNGTGTVYNSGDALPFSAASQVLYAKWTANTYTINYNVNGATGTQANSTDSYTTGGSAVTLSAVGTMAKVGHTFGGWATTANGSAVSNSYTTTANVTLYAVWNVNVIAVTYAKGSASSASFISFPVNTSGNYATRIVLSNNVDSAVTYNSSTYSFVGWSDGTSVYAPGEQYLLGDNAVTFTAIWVQAFGVRYVFNGGTPANGTSTIDAECLVVGNLCTDQQVVTANAAPTRAGYTFAGWQDQSSNAIAAGSTFTVNINSYLLYATWQAINYNITYSVAGGTPTPTQAALHMGDTFSLAAAPTRTGYTFAGWSDGTNTFGSGATYTVGTSAITLTALWTPRTYVLTYDWNGGTGTPVANGSYTVGNAGIALPGVGDHVKDGYNFGGWAATIGGDAVTTPFVATGDTVLYAIWGAGSYTVTFTPNYGVGANTVTTVANGNSTTLPTLTRSNFVFDGWWTTAATGGTKVGNGGASYIPSASRQLYARWIQSSLYGVVGNLNRVSTITASNSVASTYTGTNGGSGVSVNVPAGALPAGTVINLDLITDNTYAQSVLSGSNNYILSLAVSWLAPDETVPDTTAGSSITLTITNSSIRAGALIYSVQNGVALLLGTASANGTLTVELTADPSIYVVQTIPGTPTAVVATTTSSTATFTWIAPATDGGSAITSYLVTLSNGDTCTTATLTCTFSNLTVGTAYSASIEAINAVGSSIAATLSATPTAPVVNPPVVQPPVVEPPVVEPPVTPQPEEPEQPSKPVVFPAPVVTAVVKVLADNVPLLSGVKFVAPVQFAANSSKLDAVDLAQLRSAAKSLAGKSGTLLVTGFVKYVGKVTPAIKALATARAMAVSKALAKLGVKVKIGYLGYGPSNTANPKNSDRKVELRWVPAKG